MSVVISLRKPIARSTTSRFRRHDNIHRSRSPYLAYLVTQTMVCANPWVRITCVVFLNLHSTFSHTYPASKLSWRSHGVVGGGNKVQGDPHANLCACGRYTHLILELGAFLCWYLGSTSKSSKPSCMELPLIVDGCDHQMLRV
jgi:hypothetical protein